MLWSRFLPKEKVAIARTPAEKEAVYRFRYQIYAAEMKIEMPGTDHVAKRLCDEDDESPFARHLYAGDIGSIKGAARFFVWPPGQVPPYWYKAYAMDRFPTIDTLVTSEIGRFLVQPGSRGKLLLPSMATFTYHYMVGEEKIDLSFSNCRPQLLRYYRKLGARPYAAPLYSSGAGAYLPLVSVVSDQAYYRAQGALTTRLIPKYFGPGLRKPVDQTPFSHLFDPKAQRVEIDPSAVLDELTRVPGPPGSGANWLSRLSRKTQKKLSKSGYLLRIDPGDLLIKEGVAEREMFVLLEGSLEIVQGGKKLGVVAAGETVGEVAFFRESGVRTASVRALSPSRVLVVRHKFIEEVCQSDPATGVTILLHLGRGLAERLVRAGALEDAACPSK